jgi:hypothetical protein
MTSPGTDINALLVELLSTHGVEAVLKDGLVFLPRHELRVQSQLRDMESAPGFVTVQLDVRLEVWAGRFLIESFAGFGKTREEAVSDAVKNFVDNSFHVLLASFLSPPDAPDAQVVREEWSIGGQKKRVILGGIGVRGTLPRQGEDDLSWLQQFREKLQAQTLPEGTHWVRLYYGQFTSKPSSLEVLLDNEDWTDLRSELSRIDWPVSPGFFSVRLFLVIQGGVDVSRAIALIARMADSDDDAIVDALVSLGASNPRANRLVAFIPMAFVRVLLRSMPIRFPETARLYDPDTDSVLPGELRLSDEPIFVEASRLAEEALTHGTLTRAGFEAVAFRSAEAHVINQLLKSGSEPRDVSLTPAHIVLFGDEAGDVQHVPEAPAAASPHPGTPASRKPWWKFW